MLALFLLLTLLTSPFHGCCKYWEQHISLHQLLAECAWPMDVSRVCVCACFGEVYGWVYGWKKCWEESEQVLFPRLIAYHVLDEQPSAVHEGWLMAQNGYQWLCLNYWACFWCCVFCAHVLALLVGHHTHTRSFSLSRSGGGAPCELDRKQGSVWRWCHSQQVPWGTVLELPEQV